MSATDAAAAAAAPARPAPDYGWRLHAKFLDRCLRSLGPHASHDVNRMTLAFFSLSGLTVLPHSSAAGRAALDEHVDSQRRTQLADWILNLQIEPTEANQHRGGFRGGTFMGAPYISHLLDPAQASSTSAAQQQPHIPADCAHLVMTYTALASLAILQVPDLPSKLHREAIVASVRAAQQPNGSFASTELGSECDLRFTYAACCVSHMLGDWNGVDIPRAAAYIKASLSYEGAFGQGPGLEAHGGSTFCAVASLKLMNQLDKVLSPEEQRALLHWLVSRQNTGYTGRPNKSVDSCYSFWVGASIAILLGGNRNRLCTPQPLREFLISVQTPIIGGFSREEDVSPDPMHTYMSIMGLSLIGEPDLAPVDATLTLSQEVAKNFPLFTAK